MVDLVQSMSECYPAIPGVLPVARRAVSAVAGEAGATDEQIEKIRLALSEALTNAILHAYDDGPGDIYLTAAVAGGELWVLVADDGRGLGGPQRGNERSGLGLGLALIAQASDGLTIVKRSGGGTELRMRFRLGAATSPNHDQSHPGSAAPADDVAGGQSRGSVASATTPASSVFSTTT